MKKKILILAGGFSREREISLKTAKGVFNQIRKKYHQRTPWINVSWKNDFNANHGRLGQTNLR